MKPLTKKRYDALIQKNPGASIMFYGSTEDDMFKGLADPATVIGSDAFPHTVSATGEMARDWDIDYDAVQGHPRLAGTRGKVFRHVRDDKLVPLMTAISKMSFMVAEWLRDNGVPQMAYKGRIQLGADADLAIFDLKTVTDNSTMQHGGRPRPAYPTSS